MFKFRHFDRREKSQKYPLQMERDGVRLRFLTSFGMTETKNKIKSVQISSFRPQGEISKTPSPNGVG